MRIKISKVARGIAPGDVANSAVRNILTDLSITMRGKFTEEDMNETMKFFDYRCPYTGKNLRDKLQRGDYSEMATDHIVPQNRQYCVLNVIGNLVIVDKKANQAKKDKTVEDFLLHDQTVLAGVPQTEREARLEKIKKFQKEKQYDPDTIRAVVSPILEQFYGDVGTMLQQKANQIATGLGLSKSFAIRKQQKNWQYRTRLPSKSEGRSRLYLVTPMRIDRSQIHGLKS